MNIIIVKNCIVSMLSFYSLFQNIKIYSKIFDISTNENNVIYSIYQN